MKKIFSFVLCLAALAGFARAQSLQFTLDATATDNVFGYVAGQSYQFTITTSPSFSSTQPADYLGYIRAWDRETMSDELLFPTLNGYDISAIRQWLYVAGSFVQITIPGDGNFVGLVSPNGTRMSYFNTAFNFTTSASAGYVDPNTVLSPFVGSYAVSGADYNYVQLLDMNGTETHAFVVTNVTLGLTAVPEPATYAAVAGVAMLGFVALRRRRAARA